MIPRTAKLSVTVTRRSTAASVVVCVTMAGGLLLGGADSAWGDVCTLPDNGSWTIDLPPQCSDGYTSPEDYYLITDGLPEGTTIRVHARYVQFMDVVRTPGGNFGPNGEIQDFRSGVSLAKAGSGELNDFSHQLFFSADCEMHTARRIPSDQQTIAAEWVSLDGHILPSDPYFSSFRLTAGSDMGLAQSLGRIELDLIKDGMCWGGAVDGDPCADDIHCPDSNVDGVCVGGSNDGLPCIGVHECPGG